MTACQVRTGLAKVLSEAHTHLMASFDLRSCFESLGYLHPSPQLIKIRAIPEYEYKPSNKAARKHPPRTTVAKQRDIRNYFKPNQAEDGTQELQTQL